MKPIGSRLTKDQLKQVKGGQEKTCTATCYSAGYPLYDYLIIGYVTGMSGCSNPLARCQASYGQVVASATCTCEPMPEIP